MRTHENTIDLEENKEAFKKKIHRQIKEIQDNVHTLKKHAMKRHAEVNEVIHQELRELDFLLRNLLDQFDQFDTTNGMGWPEASKDLSAAYKDLESALKLAETRIKPK